MDMEELFRRKLENNDIIPSLQATQKLMRRLALHEFMRFNPTRFNIYYTGLIVAGIIALGVLIVSGNDKGSTENTPIDSPGKAEIIIELQDPVVIVEKVVEAKKSPVKVESNSSSSKEAPAINKVEKSLISGAELKAESAKPMNVSSMPVERKLREAASGNDVLFIPSPLSGCAPLKVHFQSENGYDSYNWSFGKEGYATTKDAEWIFQEAGSFNVVLTASKSGISYSYESVITVYPDPVASFSVYPESPVLPDDKVMFRNFSTNSVTYIWHFGDGKSSEEFEPVHRYDKYLSYIVSLTAISEHGCIDSTSKADIFSGTDYFISMPNAFIPNPDGPSGGLYSASSDEKAEIFHPVANGVTEFYFSIYSKLGIMLFETKDINTGWDGYFKGQISNPGVYIWKIKGRFRNGESFNRMGDVTLLKK